jgi:carbamoyl-phosphate synthase/aspartate carbamoyltransferase/dihydroorotase
MTTLRLPALVDVHVHMREPGGEHKETWDTGTAAALAGGIGAVLAMPNTSPAVVDAATFDLAAQRAGQGARCDWAHFVGAGLDNATAAAALADRAAGLKMYLGQTFGDLRLDDRSAWRAHLETWPEDRVVSVHAEGEVLGEIIELAAAVDRPIHICHTAGGDDIRTVASAKERGLAVTCEATPHHLFLDSTSDLPPNRAEVRPRLGTPDDRRALWEHLDVIDCFATDHAPHTISEKDSAEPPPGFPGVESMLPLLLGAAHDGLLSLDDIVARLHTNPVALFGIDVGEDSWVEIDPDEAHELAPGFTKAGWSPFDGMKVRGRVVRTVVAGSIAYEDGSVVAEPGTGRDLRAKEKTP